MIIRNTGLDHDHSTRKIVQVRTAASPTGTACSSAKRAPNIQLRGVRGHHLDAVVECCRLIIRLTAVLCGMWLPCAACLEA